MPMMTTRSTRRVFDLDQANATLPYVHRIVNDIVKTYAKVTDLRRALDGTCPNEDSPAGNERAYEQSMDRLGDLVDELNEVGAELRDFELGVIDFPAEHAGRRICWCWQLGEQSVASWHDPDDGFMGRESVETLFAAAA